MIMSFKQRIKQSFFYRNLMLIRVFIYDFNRFRKYSAIELNTERKILTKITTTYHVIEKGLSFADTRYGFGVEKINTLISLLQQYDKIASSVNNSQYISAIKVLIKYVAFHEKTIDQCDSKTKELIGKIKTFLDSIDDEIINNNIYSGGTISFSKNEYQKKAHGDFVEMSQNRCSIRNFSSEPVDIVKIKEAVRLAQKSPSTCNRQSARAYILSDKETISKVLKIHGGTRGFGHKVSSLVIMAGDLNACLYGVDRSQVYVDSALFAMNFIYAIQYLGYAGCLLHWSVAKKNDILLRKLLNIEPSHTITCVVAVGSLAEEFEVPLSQRKDLVEILTVL